VPGLLWKTITAPRGSDVAESTARWIEVLSDVRVGATLTGVWAKVDAAAIVASRAIGATGFMVLHSIPA
jgi:hypothetical protein